MLDYYLLVVEQDSQVELQVMVLEPLLELQVMM